MITCKICNKQVKSLRGMCNHIHSHNLTSTEYIEKYGDFRLPNKNNELITCPICGKYNFSNLQSHLTWKHKLTGTEFSNLYPNYKKFTESYRDQCSNAGKSSIKSQLNNQEKWKSSRKKAAITYDINHPGVRSNSAKIAHKDMSDRLIKLWQDPEYRKKMSDKCKKQHETTNLTELVMNSNKSHKRIPYKNFYMRSSWEVRFAEYLDNNEIKYDYEPFYFTYVDKLGKTRKYFPDFYIEKINTIIEIKPLYQANYDEVILKKESVLDRGFNFLMVTEVELFKDKTMLSKIIDDYNK